MNLEELYEYKNQFVQDIVTQNSIVNLLDGKCTDEGRKRLVYSQIFPYEFIPETVEEATTFICCDVDVLDVYDKTFLEPVLYVWVFTHKSKLRLEEGGVRTDKICCEIAKKINGSRFYGLGELSLKSVRRFSPINDYQGKLMTFKTREVNKYHEYGRKTPANRKSRE